MHETALALSGILGALLIGAMSPGPSFLVVARTSITLSRRHGFAAAVGMGCGGMVFAGLALLGLHAVLAQVGWLYTALRLLGGGYLVYLAYRLWRGAGEPLAVPEAAGRPSSGLLRSFGFGLATQLSNPKTAIVYASIFAALLPPGLSGWVWLAPLPLVFLVETGWYSIVAAAFSLERPKAVYLRAKARIDRLTASVMGILGIRLLLDAGR
jgi:threonine/homoserine/homoserine lactone efflux protein